MEPRELWGRHAVLAEAFCVGDERVKEAQGRLDEAQADRMRVLAAFAVTVGSSGAVADLFGLSEREVRSARKTVGKEDARAKAEELLAVPSPVVAEEENVGEGAAGESESSGGASGGAGEPECSAAVDAVLVGSWQTGIDLREMAAEFGLDMTRLVARAQQLSAQGRLPTGAVNSGEGYSGRHRRGAADVREAECTIPAQQSAGWGSVSSSPWYPASASSSSGESVTEVPALPTDWDQALAAWGGQFGPSHEEPAPPPAPAPSQSWAQYHLSS